MFANSLVSSGATAGAGILFTQFGYSRVLLGLAGSQPPSSHSYAVCSSPKKTRARDAPPHSRLDYCNLYDLRSRNL